MMLRSDQIAGIKAIISKMQKDSIFSEFRVVIPRDSDLGQDYYRIIKRPISLKDIRTNLVNGAYSTLEEVLADFDSMWDNAITFNGEGSVYATIASIGRLEVHKKIQALRIHTVEEWLERTQYLAEKLSKNLANLSSLSLQNHESS